jgi:DNA-directed RNA polymerase subunit RPC12/RpoP
MRSSHWGRRVESDDRAVGGVLVSAPAARTFACEQCGAVLAFEPGAQQLACRYCGHVNRIVEPGTAVVENELDRTLARLPPEPPAAPVEQRCRQCGYAFSFPTTRHAGPCPSCASPVVQDPAALRAIAPGAVLPFVIGEPDGRRLVRDWLHSLWFAPSRLAREARSGGRLEGLYVPHWTFDARSASRYAGRRGDVYYETRIVERVVDGRRVRQAVQVPKIRWTPVQGRVTRDFDDLLVTAGAELPRHLVERLEPWDLQGLKAYSPDYLSGFSAELYALPVTDAHEQARAMMRALIEQDVRFDIGGDQQVIERLDITLSNETYKLVLLPVWVAAFRFLGKDYRVLVNGRTGEVHGERPWSLFKIALAVLVGLVVLAGVLLALQAGQPLGRL